MAPRRRSSNKRGWPANLYERKGYFTWRHPLTREEFGLGRDRAAAFIQAVEANLHVAGLRGKARLIDKLTGSADRSVEAWNTKYQLLLAEGQFAECTRRAYKSLGGRMVRMLKPETPLQRVTALEVSQILEQVGKTEGKARTAQALRNFMRDSFREARVWGWYVGENPVMDTKLPVSVTVNRARLSLEVFRQVHDATRLVWLRNAMDLALVSGQRREDIAEALFADFHTDGWHCVQASEKTEHPHRIIIPLELRLKVYGKSLGDVLSQCRRTGVLSRHLIHQTVHRGNSPAGAKIWIDTVSKRFAAALAGLKIDWADKDPPTFHEIRSLSERLYKAEGVDTQQLLGHNDAATTALYDDPRGSEWVRIQVPV